MKIKIFFVHPTNYGNLMMVDNFIHYFRKIAMDQYNDDPDFFVDVLDVTDLERVKASLFADIKIHRENLFNRKRRGIIGKLLKIIYLPYEIIYNIYKYDACVILGGDCISQYYSKQVFISNMLKFFFISRHTPLFAAGQTMGPFKGYAIPLIRKALSKCWIYTRDNKCFQYIKNLFGFERLIESRDLAFLDLPFQNDQKIVQATIEKYVGCNYYVTIVPSGANLQYTTEIDHYISEYVTIICNTLKKTDYDVLLLAHVIHTNTSNDKIIIDQVVSQIPDKYRQRLHIVNYLVMPYEARILLGNGEYTVTGRMHAAVSSINMGVLPICLSYSVKYKGVIGDAFGLNDYILECRGDQSWQNNKVSKAIWEMQNQLTAKKSLLESKVANELSSTKKMAYDQIEDIAKHIYIKNIFETNTKI